MNELFLFADYPLSRAQKRTLLMGRPVRYCSKEFNEERI